MQKGAFWSLLEQIKAWNGHHMLRAKRMDEIEDLKMMFLLEQGFLVEVGKSLIEDGILVELGFLVEIGFLVKLGFLEDEVPYSNKVSYLK